MNFDQLGPRNAKLGDRPSRAAFDAVVATLALDVIPDAERVAEEMRRATRPGGTVSSAIHDFRVACAPLFMLWDIASVLDSCPQAVRDSILSHSLVWPQGQANMWRAIGLVDVVEVPLIIPFEYASFADYWATFEPGQGRVGSYGMDLPDEPRRELKKHVRAAYLGGRADGQRSFSVIIRAAKGRAPHRG